MSEKGNPRDLVMNAIMELEQKVREKNETINEWVQTCVVIGTIRIVMPFVCGIVVGGAIYWVVEKWWK